MSYRSYQHYPHGGYKTYIAESEKEALLGNQKETGYLDTREIFMAFHIGSTEEGVHETRMANLIKHGREEGVRKTAEQWVTTGFIDTDVENVIVIKSHDTDTINKIINHGSMPLAMIREIIEIPLLPSETAGCIELPAEEIISAD